MDQELLSYITENTPAMIEGSVEKTYATIADPDEEGLRDAVVAVYSAMSVVRLEGRCAG